jgi:ABC-type Mn2+/Zn2+ transport system ATPase subunit
MVPPVLATHDLRKRYRGRTVVDGVSLTVERGDVYGFLGPNGAGKSTTLRMVLDLVRPSGGRVELFGRPPSDRRVLARVGAIVESPALYTLPVRARQPAHAGRPVGRHHRRRASTRCSTASTCATAPAIRCASTPTA